MHDGTDLPNPRAGSRAEWRDALRALSNNPLSTNARFVGLTIADYWPKEGQYVWCAVRVIAGHTGMVERTVHRALRELQENGYLHKAKQHTSRSSPRYVATNPIPSRTPASSGESLGLTQGQPGAASVSALGMTDSQVTPEVLLHTESTSGSDGSTAGHRAPVPAPRKRAKPKKRRPLTQAERQASYNRFRWMDLGDVPDDHATRVKLFVWMESDPAIKAFEPDAWAAVAIEQGTWADILARHYSDDWLDESA